LQKQEQEAVMKTLYDLLGVDRHASFSDIERSYRHSLNEHIAGGSRRAWRKADQLRLQKMRQAFLVLSSPSRRMDYDLKLDQQEHARLRTIERVGTIVGVLMLIAGLALIARGVFHHRETAPAEHAASAHPSQTVLVAEDAMSALRPNGEKPVGQK
jgi:hypothetical protein